MLRLGLSRRRRGLLRTRVANNWDITEHFVIDNDFYTKDQQQIIREIFEGIINPEWHERIDKQLEDDAGGYGEQNSIAIFGKPGSDKFEFVMTGRHMTIRCDGNSADHVAFGGPIFYGHAADDFDEEAEPPGQRLLAAGRGGQQAVRDARRKAAEAGAACRRVCRASKSRLPRQGRRLPGLAGHATCRAIRRSTCKKCWRCSSSRIARAIATK